MNFKDFNNNMNHQALGVRDSMIKAKAAIDDIQLRLQDMAQLRVIFTDTYEEKQLNPVEYPRTWIKTANRLPKEKQLCLLGFVNPSGETLSAIGAWHNGVMVNGKQDRYWRIVNKDFVWPFHFVSHWLPIPEIVPRQGK